MAITAQVPTDSALDQALGNVLRTANGLLCTDALALFLSESETPDAWLGAGPDELSSHTRSEYGTRLLVPLDDGRSRLLLLWRAPGASGTDLVLAQATRLLGSDAAAVYTREPPDGELLAVRAARGLAPDQTAGHLRLGTPVTGLSVQQRRAIVCA